MYSLKALGGKRLGDVEESGSKVARQPVINSGWMRDVFIVTKTTLHKEPLLIIYTVMYYPAESGMWTLSVNWNVRTNQAKNQVLSQCTYIVH